MADVWVVHLTCGCCAFVPIEQVPDVGLDYICNEHGDQELQSRCSWQALVIHVLDRVEDNGSTTYTCSCGADFGALDRERARVRFEAHVGVQTAREALEANRD